MADGTTIDDRAHPAPHRHRIGLVWLLLAIFAPPAVWSVHLIVNYASASRACYPDGSPQSAPAVHWLWLLLIIVDVVSLLISAGAVAIAYRSWQISAEEMAEHTSPMVETGEGRTRFLAIWGLLIGAGFFVAVIFDFVGLWILPICD
jgi:hypothetical protein